MRDIPSSVLVKEIRAGWNLGNSLEVYRKKEADLTPGDYETYWGNPITSPALIEKVKKAGFNLIRIPVNWECHMGESPDYKIDKVWFNRVKEIVDYAIDEKTFVIINIHHEGWIVPLEKNYSTISDKLIKVWTQIADFFKDYDEHLIFQSMNEPRLVDTDIEWTDGNEEARNVIKRLNLDFVRTIRSSGGNNLLRHLMITGYCSAGTENVVKDIQIPDDNKIIISVHAYKPYDFTLNFSGTSEWNSDIADDISDIITISENLKKYFINKNIPVIIDEFGSVNKFNNSTRLEHLRFFVSTFKKLGIPCAWWDNGVLDQNGERFGIINRQNGEWYFPDIAEAIMQYSNNC